MPLYDYFCDKCNFQFDDFRRVIDREFTNCPQCGTLSKKIFSKNRFIKDLFVPYVDTNLFHDPVFVESKNHRKELMKKAGVVEK